MKPFYNLFLVSLLFPLLTSCGGPNKPQLAAFKAMCAFTTDNYTAGEFIVFESTTGRLDTLQVHDNLSDKSSPFIPNKGMGIFGTIIFSLDNAYQHNDSLSILFQACFDLYSENFSLLTGNCYWYHCHNHTTHIGGEVSIDSNEVPSDKLLLYHTTEGDTAYFAEFQSDFGLVRFGSTPGESYTFKERL